MFGDLGSDLRCAGSIWERVWSRGTGRGGSGGAVAGAKNGHLSGGEAILKRGSMFGRYTW